MTDLEHDDRHPRKTRTRWSVFEPLGHEEDAHGDAGEEGSPDDAGSDSQRTEALDPLLVAVAGELRRPVSLDAALDARIMKLVASEPLPRREAPAGPARRGADSAASATDVVAPHSGAWGWLRRPHLVRVTPLGGLAAVAGLAAMLALAVRIGSLNVEVPAAGSLPAEVAAAAPEPSPPTPAADVAPIQVVQFVLVAPGARTVALVGDFNDWQAGATPLRAAAAGRVWSVEVPLAAGRHRYAFVVDQDQWVPDPSAPRAAGDDFGTPSSVVTVAEHRS